MKHYTETISADLAKKLKDKGMPIEKEDNNIWCPSYAEVMDWLMEEGKVICPEVEMDEDGDIWDVYIVRMADNLIPSCIHLEGFHTWHEAANAAIEKALELIKEK